MATLNAAEAFGLADRGAIAPGRRADLVVTPSLAAFRATQVVAGGRLVAREGAPVGPWPSPHPDEDAVRGTVNVDVDALDLRIPAEGTRVRAIGVVPEQIVTEERVMDAQLVSTDGGQEAVSDPARDLLKLAVIERHRGTGRTGLGFVHGLGLQRGAIAGSVGHDCHNVIVAGVSDDEMRAAVRAVKALGGGLVAVLEGEVIGSVPLPIAGLMSDRPVETVRRQMDDLLEAARSLGSPLHDPLMHLGFLALEVIPKLKLTDQGLVDVDQFDFVPLWV
jgi:adenine deaminase